MYGKPGNVRTVAKSRGIFGEKSTPEKVLLLTARLRLHLPLVSPVLTIARSDASHLGRDFTTVCLSVYPHDISRTDADKITKCSTMSPGNPFILGSKVNVSHKDSAGVGLCTLVSAGF